MSAPFGLAFPSTIGCSAESLPSNLTVYSLCVFLPSVFMPSVTTFIDPVAGGMKVVTDGMNTEGKKTHNEYTVKFDGKDSAEHPMVDGKANPNGADMISIKKIDD